VSPVRWYDANKVTPVFPFGHGLSYTSFAYEALSVRAVAHGADPKEIVAQVELTVTNSGKRDGSEVVQLYLSFPSSAPAAHGEPPKQLKAFVKVPVSVGDTVKVGFPLIQRDISTWDSEKHAWAPVKGEFGVLIGASAADIRLSPTIHL